jgi:hypothetical protein
MPAPARFRALRPAEVATRDRTVRRDVRAGPLPASTAKEPITQPITQPVTSPVAAPSAKPPVVGPVRPTTLGPSNAAVAAALRTDTGPKLVLDRLRPVAQNMIGNSAVAAARGAAPPAVEEKRAVEQKGAGRETKQVRGPRSDPKFAALKKDVQHKKRTVAASHPPPHKEAAAAQEAALPPRDDDVAQGKTANAEKMNEAKPKEFDRDAFIRAVEEAIERKAPKNLDQADRFAESGKPEEIKADVRNRVGDGKADSAEQIATTTAAPPDTSVAVEKKVVPMAPDRPSGAQATPDPAQAVPDKLPPEATDLSAGPAKVDQQLADAHVTETQLGKANEPAFTNALQQKQTADQHAETAPGQLRKNEAAQLRSSTTQAKKLGTSAMQAMAAERVATGQRVGTGKSGAKGRDEDKRAEVTAILQRVFDTMKTDVENILSGLDKLVDDQFTRGEKAARDAFTAEHRQKMDEYKDRRYGGVLGWARWLDDQFTGLPAEADKIFDDARAGYVQRMRQVISDVATTIGTELGRAKRRIAQGRDDLQAEVRKLPSSLQSIGKEAAAGFAGQFDELTQTVDDKGDELVDTLATKYTDAVKSVDDEIAAAKEMNKGLVDKAIDAVKGVIDTIMALKDLLLAVLAKAVQAVFLILGDPIGFLSNLVSGVGAGLKQFMANIGRHLQEGIMSWLLGRTAEAGIKLPDRFDTRGVLLLLAELLGLTWQGIRARITRRVPEQAVAAAETAIPLVNQVRRQGVAGMWDDLKARVGDLRKDLMDKVIQYVTPTIVLAGIKWVLSLLNPASTFVRAVQLIIDIVRFVVTQARQIMEFVNAVLDAVIAIARGGAGGVPALVERALARSIPVLLGFLAALLGVGGIAGRVKQIVQAMAKPVGRVIDTVIDKIVGLVRNLWAKLRSTMDKKRRPARKKPRPDKKKPAKRKPKPTRPGKARPKTRRHDKEKPDYDRVLAAALRDARALVAKDMPVEEIQERLPPIRREYRLTRLDVVVERTQGLVNVIHFVAVVNPMKKSRPENAPLTAEEAREEAGLLLRSQQMFQRYADQHKVVIEVRLTNPESVPHLEAGALFKAREIKPKTINAADVLLGLPPDKRGLVGFFLEGPPDPDTLGLTPAQLAIAQPRYEQRLTEWRRHRAAMDKLAEGPDAPGKYVVEDNVVYGFTQKGKKEAVAGDHDLFDITTLEGKHLPEADHLALIEDMRQKNFGVMHGTVVYWKDWGKRDADEWRSRRDLIAGALQEGMIRFAPDQPMRWVKPGTRIWRRPFRGRR